MATAMPETDPVAVTPWRRVVRYHPQRVQTVAVAVLNLLLVVLAETGIDLSTVLVGALNTTVLAVLVFVYGEPSTWSRAAIDDWLAASEAHANVTTVGQ